MELDDHELDRPAEVSRARELGLIAGVGGYDLCILVRSLEEEVIIETVSATWDEQILSASGVCGPEVPVSLSNLLRCFFLFQMHLNCWAVEFLE